MAKRFALVSFGVLCLMVSVLIGFHLGGESAQAQAPGVVLGFSVTDQIFDYVFLDNGDVYFNYRQQRHTPYTHPAVYVGNFWTGETAPVPTTPSTVGNVKGKYDGNK